MSDNEKRLALPAYRPRPADAPLPLAGVRVIDFTHFIAGPYATLILADFGAEVVKIESADGDGFRNFPPFIGQESASYLWVNRNKVGVVLDLKTPEGQGVAAALIDGADIVVENFSTGVMDRLGLGYERLAERNPRLIYCSVSAYGRSGPYAGRVGFDSIAQAESGFMSMNGFPEQEPMRTGPPIMDMATAMMAANAIQAALIARGKTGKGQRLEVSLIEAAVSMMGNFHAAYLATGVSPSRVGNTQVTACPIGYFQTTDKPIYLTCANDRIFQRLMRDALGQPAIASHPDFATNLSRIAHRERLTAIITGILRRDTRDSWLKKMHAAGVPAGAVRTVGEALDAPELRHLEMLSTVDHPTLGPIPSIGLPVHFSETPVADPVAAPVLGQDTDRVLGAMLGYSQERIDALARTGALGRSRQEAE